MLTRVASHRGLSRVVGERLKALRQQYGDSAEDVASAARDLGLTWRRATVAQIENGERGLSAEELVLLPLILGLACGLPHSWEELIGDGDDVRLGPEVTVARSVVVDVLSGRAGELGLGAGIDAPLAERERQALKGFKAALPQLRAWWEAAWPGMTFAQGSAAQKDAAREAEQKAARKLGVSPLVLSVAAHRTWGRGLTDERDRRVAEQTSDDASARTVQAVRGHVTRRLLDEVADLTAEVAAATDEAREAG